jgi:hypothetical protein
MTTISAQVTIKASPEQVWAVLADLASYSQWNPMFCHASGQLIAGNTITLQSIVALSGRTMTITATILAAQTASELRWTSAKTGEHTFTLTPASKGTHLVQTETRHGIRACWSARIAGHTQANIQFLNQAIKQRAENSQEQHLANI